MHNAFAETNERVREIQNGVIVRDARDGFLKVRFVAPEIVRIQYAPEGEWKGNGTDACLPREERPVPVRIERADDSVALSSDALHVVIDEKSGAIRCFDAKGGLLLREHPETPRTAEKIPIRRVTFDNRERVVEKTANGDQIVEKIASEETVGEAWKAEQRFLWEDGEALYGLGSHQEDYMNLRGTRQFLYQHNLKISMPVLVSSKGYGLFFDAGCVMEFRDDAEGGCISMDAVNEIDCYFMYGPSIDDVVKRFRFLTGAVSMMPKYAFGYVQSRERYATQKMLEDAVDRFRAEKIPLDVIVQDWNYWDPRWWGHKMFRKDAYPDPTAMIRHVHDRNARYMLSLWPSANGNEGEEMGAKGYVLGRGIYDAYNPEARKMYWDEYVWKNLGSHGVDFWWCDGSEPIDGDWTPRANAIANNPEARRKCGTKVLNELLGPLRANTYSLHHSQGIYENARRSAPEKRPAILTRSAFPGQQRYAAFVWNGDTRAAWESFAQQIPSGLNYMATGSPYWTIDAGAFFVKDNGKSWFWKGEFQKGLDDLGFHEYYLRNLQYCVWLPMMRSHGTDCPREPWQFGKPGDMFYDAILAQIRLRYRLLPYVYSLAAMVHFEDYTMTRPLIFDFQNDPNVFDLKDEFMFGPAFLVCPVVKPMLYEPGSKELIGVEQTRTVYLPKASGWFDFHTGKRYEGGRILRAAAPIDRIPVFVKAGSIVPMGPVVQWSSEKPDAPWELRVYPGADADFTIYEDDGESNKFEKGECSRIALHWDDANRRLSFAERVGSYDGMTRKREFRIVIVDAGKGVGSEETQTPDAVIHYDGTAASVSF